MAKTPLVELAKDNAQVNIHTAPKRGVDVRFYFKATAIEVTADKLNAMLDLIIEDLNKGWKAEFGEAPAFKTQLTKGNVHIQNVVVGSDKKLTFEVSLQEVEFDSINNPNAQRAAANSILRTLNTYLPHALKQA